MDSRTLQYGCVRNAIEKRRNPRYSRILYLPSFVLKRITIAFRAKADGYIF